MVQIKFQIDLINFFSVKIIYFFRKIVNYYDYSKIYKSKTAH